MVRSVFSEDNEINIGDMYMLINPADPYRNPESITPDMMYDFVVVTRYNSVTRQFTVRDIRLNYELRVMRYNLSKEMPKEDRQHYGLNAMITMADPDCCMNGHDTFGVSGILYRRSRHIIVCRSIDMLVDDEYTIKGCCKCMIPTMLFNMKFGEPIDVFRFMEW